MQPPDHIGSVLGPESNVNRIQGTESQLISEYLLLYYFMISI